MPVFPTTIILIILSITKLYASHCFHFITFDFSNISLYIYPGKNKQPKFGIEKFKFI
jgi:hypothetical protein